MTVKQRAAIGLLAAALITAGGSVLRAEEPQQTTATYRDWTVRCAVAPGQGQQKKSCEMVQAAHVQGQSAPISQIAISPPAKPGQPSRLVVELPVGVWLPFGVKIGIDGAATVEASFKRCLPAACFADVELKDDLVKKMRAASQQGTILFQDGNQRDIKLPLSFKGFGEAYEALGKL